MPRIPAQTKRHVTETKRIKTIAITTVDLQELVSHLFAQSYDINESTFQALRKTSELEKQCIEDLKKYKSVIIETERGNISLELKEVNGKRSKKILCINHHIVSPDRPWRETVAALIHSLQPIIKSIAVPEKLSEKYSEDELDEDETNQGINMLKEAEKGGLLFPILDVSIKTSAPTNAWQNFGSSLIAPLSWTYHVASNFITNWVKVDRAQIIERLKNGECAILKTYNGKDILLELKKNGNGEPQLGIVKSREELEVLEGTWEKITEEINLFATTKKKQIIKSLKHGDCVSLKTFSGDTFLLKLKEINGKYCLQIGDKIFAGEWRKEISTLINDVITAKREQIIEDLKYGMPLESYADGDRLLTLKTINGRQQLCIVTSTGCVEIVKKNWQQKLATIIDDPRNEVADIAYEPHKSGRVKRYESKLEQTDLIERTEGSITLYTKNGTPIKKFNSKTELDLYVRYRLNCLKDQAAVCKQREEASEPRMGTLAMLSIAATAGMAVAPIAFSAIEILVQAFGSKTFGSSKTSEAFTKAFRNLYNFEIGPTRADAASADEDTEQTNAGSTTLQARDFRHGGTEAASQIVTYRVASPTSTPEYNLPYFADGTHGFVISGDFIGESIYAADINGDGNPEIFFGDNSKTVYVLWGEKPGEQWPATINLPLDPAIGFKIIIDVSDPNVLTLATVDLNQNGKPDIVIGNCCGHEKTYVFLDRQLWPPVVHSSELNGTNGFVLIGSGTPLEGDYSGYALAGKDGLLAIGAYAAN